MERANKLASKLEPQTILWLKATHNILGASRIASHTETTTESVMAFGQMSGWLKTR